MERRKLNYLPCDRFVELESGKEECCHATGYEVKLFGEWWYEYEDSDGCCHYLR